VTLIPVVIEGRTRMLDVRQLLDGVDLVPSRATETMDRRDTRPITAFVSYAHKDDALRQELDTSLKVLVREGVLDLWHDCSIVPGEKWEERIDENLQRADLVLLLISRDFIASDYCQKEMQIALGREAVGQTRVVPIILRPCAWRRLPVQANHALPREGNPIAPAGHKPGHHDELWLEVEEGIRRALHDLGRRAGR
jgi:internalin A